LRQAGDAVYALLPAELVDSVVARLRRFVLRAKVSIERAHDLRVVWAERRAEHVAASAPGDDVAIAPDDDVASAPDDDAGSVVFAIEPGRRAIAVPSGAPPAGADPVSVQARPEIGNDWRAADIAAGLPQICCATSEAFTPQMLNLDRLDGLSFGKGCYTGQEIVVRTQHLGRIKRRTLRYRLPPGTEPPLLSGLALDGVKVAEVLLTATRPGGIDLLAVTSLEARGRALATEDGRIAEPQALPYALVEADVSSR
jgi:folate-binding protein YgfZ